MKINHFAVIPSLVRYDSYLSDKSKLLWGEIAAASNTYGICEEDNNYFASIFKVDRRTIIRCLDQLIENGHVVRMEEKGRRKLKVVMRVLPLPEDTTLKVTHEVNQQEDLDFCNKLLSTWEERTKHSIPDKEAYVPIIKQRLKTFSGQEILQAMEKRIHYIHISPWHRDPANAETALSIDAILTDDEDTLKWLNYKEKE